MVEVPQSHCCHLPSGQQIAWREWGAGEPLIMLHGWSMSSAVFSEVATELAVHYRVLCPDLPGHGQSDPAATGDLDALAASVADWAALLDISQAALLGWSLGGQVALQIAAAKRLAITKLLLISTTPRFCQSADWEHGLPVTQVRTLDRNLGRAFEKTMGDFFKQQFVAEDMPKERYRQIISFAVRSGKLPDPQQARQSLAILGAADLRGNLATIDVPTLVMHGELDQIIPLAAGQYLAQTIPKAQLYRMPAIGHAPFFSRPEESIAQWLGFLQCQ